MKIAILSAAVASALLAVGCVRTSGFDSERYKSAVRDGFTRFPQACEIEKLFGEADHFISYSGPRVNQRWTTDVYFGGRYELTMQVDVKVNNDFSKILEVIGEPKFYLEEINRIEVNDNGTILGGGNGTAIGVEFSMKDWKRIVEANGDFSVIGVHIKKNQPVPNFEKFVEVTRRSRIQVHPNCGGDARPGQRN